MRLEEEYKAQMRVELSLKENRNGPNGPRKKQICPPPKLSFVQIGETQHLEFTQGP